MKKIAVVLGIVVSLLVPSQVQADEVIPALIGVSSPSGDIDGGNTVTLSGANFTESTVIRVGGVVATSTFISSTEVSVVMPPRSAGFVSIGAFSGMVGAVLPNSYEYIDIPDPVVSEPEPTPTPEPTVSPEPSPTPSPSISTPPLSSSASGGGTSSVVIPSTSTTNTSLSNSTNATQAIAQENLSVTAENNFPVYRFSNNIQVFTNDTQMNVVADSVFTKRLRITLQKRVNNVWRTISVSYRNTQGQVVFYGVPLDSGSYRLVNATKPLRWFSIPQN